MLLETRVGLGGRMRYALTDLWSRAAVRSYTEAELAAGIACIIPRDGTAGGGLSVLRVEAASRS